MGVAIDRMWGKWGYSEGAMCLFNTLENVFKNMWKVFFTILQSCRDKRRHRWCVCDGRGVWSPLPAALFFFFFVWFLCIFILFLLHARQTFSLNAYVKFRQIQSANIFFFHFNLPNTTEQICQSTPPTCVHFQMSPRHTQPHTLNASEFDSFEARQKPYSCWV